MQCNGHQFHYFGIIHGVAVARLFFGGPAASGVPIAPRLDSRILLLHVFLPRLARRFCQERIGRPFLSHGKFGKVCGIAAVMWCFPILTLHWAENDKMSTMAAWCRGRGNFQFACIPQNMVQESTSGGVNDQIVKNTSTKVKSLGSRKNNLQVAGKYFLLICFFWSGNETIRNIKKKPLDSSKKWCIQELEAGGGWRKLAG